MSEPPTELERRRQIEVLSGVIEGLKRPRPEHGPRTEADVVHGCKEVAAKWGLELLTPLAACDLFAKTAPTVRRAVADGLVYSPFMLNASGKPVRLIELESAIAYWGRPSERRLDEMRANGNLLRIGRFDYNILHPEPLITPHNSNETDAEEKDTEE